MHSIIVHWLDGGDRRVWDTHGRIWRLSFFSGKSRSGILTQSPELGGFRSGSITAIKAAPENQTVILRSHCHSGRFPADIELYVENTEFSLGVRRMQTVVGQD